MALAALLFLGLEGGCRVIGRARTGQWPLTRAEAYTRFVEDVGKAYQPHPFLVACGRPNAVLRKLGKEVRFNTRGYRGDDFPVPKPAGTYRIVCAGGSTTFDLLATNNDATWPARLGTLLRDRHVDVVNAGFPGWTSVQSLISLELRELDFAPDLVVVYHGINETQPAGHDPFYPDYSVGYGEILPRVLGIVPVPIRLASRSLLVEKLLGTRADRQDEGFAPAWEWKGGKKKDDVPDAAVATYERNLRSLIAVASSRGARTLLVAQTARLRAGLEARDRLYIESWAPGLTADGYRQAVVRYNASARKLADEGLALYLDPFEGNGFGDADFSDPVHFSDQGSVRMAALVAETVSRLLPSGPPR